MLLQTFCLPVSLDSRVYLHPKRDLIADSLYEEPETILIHAESTNALLDIRIKTIYDHKARSIYQFNSETLPFLFHPCFLDVLDKEVGICKIDAEIGYNHVPEISFVGHAVGVEIAQSRLPAIFDHLNKLYVETFYLPLHLQYPIAGNNSINVETIMNETKTNIYLQKPLSQSFGALVEPFDGGHIYISGEQNEVEAAKTRLRRIAEEMAPRLYKVSIDIDPVKIDWLLVNKRDELEKIMIDNGCFISFPSLCSEDEKVRIVAQNKASGDHTLCLLNRLVCNIYEVSICFKLPVLSGDHEYFPQQSLLLNTLYEELPQISAATKAELTYRSEIERLYILGTHEQVRNAACKLYELKYLIKEITWVTVSFEFPTEEKPFVIGKGKGKVKKIKSQCDVSLRFKSYNDHSTLLRIESSSLDKAMNGYFMMLQELPSEISFYIPESQHRRIIGSGGKNIQKIMKNNCVYVKFLSGPSFDGQRKRDNVVVRTPMKNHRNLLKTKDILLDLTSPKKPAASKLHKGPYGTDLELIGIELNDIELEMSLLSPVFFDGLKKKIEGSGKVIIRQYLKHSHSTMKNVQLVRCFEETKRVLIYALQHKHTNTNKSEIARKIVKGAVESAGHTFTELAVKNRSIHSFLEIFCEA